MKKMYRDIRAWRNKGGTIRPLHPGATEKGKGDFPMIPKSETKDGRATAAFGIPSWI